MTSNPPQITEGYFINGDDVSLVKQQDCEPIIKAIHEVPDMVRRVVNTQSSNRYIGSVPNLIAVEWAKEWGVRLYSHEWKQKAAYRLKNDPNWSKLRVRT